VKIYLERGAVKEHEKVYYEIVEKNNNLLLLQKL
jgi:hypothetical protein